MHLMCAGFAVNNNKKVNSRECIEQFQIFKMRKKKYNRKNS